MDRDKLQNFVSAAEDDLASARSSLLIVAQTGEVSDLAASLRNLARVRHEASAIGMAAVEELCAECEGSIEQLAAMETISPGAVYAALDIVARIEASLWNIPMSDRFLTDIAEFIDASFEELVPQKETERVSAEVFEVDEETLEIFRSEAEELLSNISGNLNVLSVSPTDQNALWEVRRNAHTLKGAAGIVGLKEASEVAHQMEDLLDKMAEIRCEAAPHLLQYLNAASKRLEAITSARTLDDDVEFDQCYVDAMAWVSLASEAGFSTSPTPPDKSFYTATSGSVTPKTTVTSIVRVSLDRLDELINLSRSLIINRSAIEQRFAEIETGQSLNGYAAKLSGLLDAQKALTEEIQAKLLRIRMVKFGTLETRLSRNVNVTCGDEDKKAILEIENGEVEIDTQIIDALIEPLLHLLKNAVVHGIEPPETRRLIGKCERGRIVVKVEADDEALVMSVADDGAGISTTKLKEKAVASGVITEDQADSMCDRDAIQLIFDRGLTTADKIDMNAGRGVGMSIVKEAVENRGGSVLVKSEPQRGTTFTIVMPLDPAVIEIFGGQPVADAKSHSDPPLVLIVDDSASVRLQSTKLVERAGLRVITADNGADALELLLDGEWEPDLILSDVEMPQIDGWSFLEYVKTDANFGHIPVVMVTSLDAKSHRMRALELGASDYLIKPLIAKDLSRVVEGLTCKPSST